MENSDPIKLVLEQLKNNPRGMTIKQLSDATNYSRETVNKAVIILGYQNEIYSVKFGNVEVFCSNHRKIHDKDVLKIEGINRKIYINRIENEFGEVIKISERRKKNENWETMGSILISPEKLKEFIKLLKEIEERPEIIKASE